jgi:hypothetical protein
MGEGGKERKDQHAHPTTSPVDVITTIRRQRSGTESQEVRAGSMEIECGVQVERVFRRVCGSCLKAREEIWERVGRRGVVAWWRVKLRGGAIADGDLVSE